MTALGQGREAEILPWDDGRVLRLLRDPAGGDRLARERIVLRCVRDAGVAVPEVFDLVEVDGRPGLVMERLDGGDLLDELPRRPWRAPRIAKQLGVAQARLHQVEAPSELLDLHEVLAERLTRAAELSAGQRAEVERRLASLPAGDRICHGDFHPGNVMLADDEPVIIDWTNAARGDPDADLARTTLLLGVGVIPGDQSRMARTVDRLGRGIVQSFWQRGYRSVRVPDPGRLEQWRTVWAAARLAEGIDEEQEELVTIVAEGLDG